MGFAVGLLVMFGFLSVTPNSLGCFLLSPFISIIGLVLGAVFGGQVARENPR